MKPVRITIAGGGLPGPARAGATRARAHGMTRDPAGDFDHPRIAEGSPLRRHVLYRLRQVDWRL